MPSASHLRIFFEVSFFGFRFVSSPEDAFAGFATAFRALLDFGPAFPTRSWLAGVDGRDVSGVGMGVASVESPSLCALIWADRDTAARPGKGGGSSRLPLSELEGGEISPAVTCTAR